MLIKIIDVVVLDRMMGNIDGIDILRQINNDVNLKNIPVILLTGMDIEEDIKDRIEAGAFQYLTKPIDNEKLIEAIKSALIDAENKNLILEKFSKNKKSLSGIRKGSFTYKTPEDANNLSMLIAICFPDSASALMGLSELMMNGIEHGNLNISPTEKKELLSKGNLYEEINRRLNLPEYNDKFVTVNYEYNEKQLVVTIEDQGKGFDWRKYTKNRDVDGTNFSGRGIIIARSMGFDEIKYEDPGKKVIVKSYL